MGMSCVTVIFTFLSQQHLLYLCIHFLIFFTQTLESISVVC